MNQEIVKTVLIDGDEYTFIIYKIERDDDRLDIYSNYEKLNYDESYKIDIDIEFEGFVNETISDIANIEYFEVLGYNKVSQTWEVNIE